MQRSVSNPLPELPQHPPAQRVAGRRMSATKPRPHVVNDHKPEAKGAPNEDEPAEPADYPRPAAPGTAEPHQHNQHEEEQPKREKKLGQGSQEHERRLKEDLYRKAEHNRPTKDIPCAKGGAGSRISQPASKLSV